MIPMDLEENVRQLHQVLYPSEVYTPSREVQRINGEIEEQTHEYMQ